MTFKDFRLKYGLISTKEMMNANRDAEEEALRIRREKQKENPGAFIDVWPTHYEKWTTKILRWVRRKLRIEFDPARLQFPVLTNKITCPLVPSESVSVQKVRSTETSVFYFDMHFSNPCGEIPLNNEGTQGDAS